MAFELVHMSDDAKAGAWPEAGGVFAQTATFVGYHRYIRSEAARIEADRYKSIGGE